MQDKVVNGEPVTEKTKRHVVSVRKYSVHECGGTLVSVIHVVTVAHCFIEEIMLIKPNYENYRVLIGSTHLEKNGIIHYIDDVIPHENFLKTEFITSYDIAIVIVS